MILGVNGIRLIGKRSGVGRCIEAVLACLDEVDHPFEDVRVYTPEPIGADVRLPSCARNVVLPSRLPRGLWEQVTLPKAHGTEDLLLCPSYVVPLFARCPTFLIHHGSYEGFPKAFGWRVRVKSRLLFAASAWRATAVSTVSEQSRRDMARFYGLGPDRVHVVPEGVDTRLFRPMNDARALAAWRRETLGSDTPFLVYVGKPTVRRNLSALIRAFASLKRNRGIPHKLVLVGVDLEGGSPFRRVIDEVGVAADVHLVGYADHREMAVVYNAADVLVYPSLYEGFGMPVLEAMACGTPVVALDNTAFPEFAAGVALLLQDDAVETLERGIGALLDDCDRRRDMSLAGPKRAAAYDWRLVTRRYVDLLRPLVTG